MAVDLMTLLSNPLFMAGLGIIGANRPGVGPGQAIGSGAMQGLLNAAAYQASREDRLDQQRQRMLQDSKLKMQMRQMEAEQARREQLAAMAPGFAETVAGYPAVGLPTPEQEMQARMYSDLFATDPGLMSDLIKQRLQPSGLERELRTLGIKPGTPEAYAYATRPSSTTRVNVTNLPEGYQPLTSTVQTQAQKDLMSTRDELATLDQIIGGFDPSFLTYQGQVAQQGKVVLDKLGMLPQDWEAGVQQHDIFVSSISDWFNQYRVKITGAAAAIAEIERLRQATINPDNSPAQFLGRVKALRDKMQRVEAAREEALGMGLRVGTKAFGAYVDARSGVVNEEGKADTPTAPADQVIDWNSGR